MAICTVGGAMGGASRWLSGLSFVPQVDDKAMKVCAHSSQVATPPSGDLSLLETPSKDGVPKDSAPVQGARERDPAIIYKLDGIICSGAVLKPTQFIGRISEILDKIPSDFQISRVRPITYYSLTIL